MSLMFGEECHYGNDINVGGFRGVAEGKNLEQMNVKHKISNIQL